MPSRHRHRPPLVQAAINGSRSRDEHPKVPRTDAELAADARASLAAGARSLHLHLHDADGRESLDADVCAATLTAVRAACPGIPVSLSTAAAIEPDPRRRRAAIARWTVLPELVSANLGEAGIVELAEDLLARGVGIEAGLSSPADAEALVRSGLGPRCARVLVEPLEPDAEDAVATAAAIERIVVAAGIEREQVHHGFGPATWAVSQRALRRGHGIRTGLEDTTTLPDGRTAAGNAALVRAAVTLVEECWQPTGEAEPASAS